MSVVANVAINVDSRGATQKLREVQVGARATEKAFNALTQAAAAFGAGFAISRVIADVKELDTNLRRLGTVGGDVAALDKGLGQLSKNLDGIASKAELAAASYQALSAGFTETGANLKVVEAATKAAVGGLVDVTSVVEVTTKTLNAYGLSGNQAIKVTDSISKAIEYGQVQWSDYTSQLGRVAATAALAGVSIDEINAFVAAATKNGATAEVAFTGLSAALATLLKPTKESQDAAAQLGIAWNIGGLQAKGFSGLLEELSKKQDTNKTAVAELLGSQEALRGVLAANSKAGKDYQMILEGLGGAAGKTDKDFQTMKDSLDNQLKALDTAFKNLSEALGKAFGPAVVDSISDITGVINGFADAINATPRPVLDAAAAIAKAVVQVLLLQKAIQGILALRAALLGMFAATATGATTAAGATASLNMNMRYLQGSMVQAQAAASPLLLALGRLAAFGSIAIAVNVAIYGLQELQRTQEILDRLRGKKPGGIPKSGVFPGETRAGLLKRQQQQRGQIPALEQKIKAQEAIVAGSPVGMGMFARRELDILKGRLAEARRTVAADASKLPVGGPSGLPVPTPTPQAPTPGEGANGRGKKDKTAEEQARMQARLQGLSIETNAIQKQLEIRQKITDAEIAGDQQLATRLQGEERVRQIIAGLQGDLVGITDERERQAVITKTAAEIDAAQAQTAGELAKLDAARAKAVGDVVVGLDMELLGLQANTDAKKQALQFLQIENQLKEQGIILTNQDAEAIRKKIEEINKAKKAQEEINAKLQMEKDLFDGMANTLAGTFNSAFDAAISGTENLGQALGKLGTDLLATIGKMLIMYAIAQALGALGGKDGVGVFSTLAKAFGYKGAKDGAYWQGGFQAFANGGVVTSPTMGLIGEGGEPEYVIPASKMRGAMNRYAAGARGSSVIPGSGETDTPDNGMVATAPIDVRYTVERINNVDYVTSEQFQRGMDQAAKQGAALGKQQVYSELTNKRSLRSRLAI